MRDATPYRPAPDVPLLPLARRHLRALTVVFLVVGALAVGSPPAWLTIACDLRDMGRLAGEASYGGVAMWAVFVAWIPLAAFLLAYGSLAVRGRPVPAGLLSMFAIGPVVVGALAVLACNHGDVVHAWRDDRLRGLERTSNVIAWCSAIGGSLAYVALIALFFSVLGVDRHAVVVDERAKPRVPPFGVTLAAGVVAYVAMASVRFAVGEWSGLDAVVFVVMVQACAFCALAAQTLAAVSLSARKEDASDMWRTVAAAGGVAVVAVGLFDLAMVVAPFVRLTGCFIDGVCGPFVAAFAPVYRARAAVLFVDPWLVLLPFAATLAFGAGAPRKSSLWGMVAAVAFAATLGLVFVVGDQVARLIAAIADGCVR